MRVRSVTFVAPWQVELREEESSWEKLADRDLLIDTECTVVSAGTELALLSGREAWARLPCVPGYGSVGVVREAGAAVKDFRPGDRVFSYASHQSPTLARGLIVRVPDDLDPRLAVLARMAQVGFTAPRVSNAELGDTAAVIGLGLVGNLAAQFMALSGCTVIGIDLSARRLEVARACGIEHTVNARETDPVEAVRQITQGAMCEAVVEASGSPDLVVTAARLAGKLGEVILLGSPRGEFTGDAMALLNAVHLWGNGCVTLKGGHEWRYPTYQDPNGHIKHSLERNLRLTFDFIRHGKLHVEELVSHCLPPSQCAEAYANLRARNEDYLGVVFDWRQPA
jgi:threonine dehydrogenase-like Zn-dependent dehydrogenase